MGLGEHAFLCIELVDSSRFSEFEQAVNDLAETVQDNLGGTCERTILDANIRELNIG